MCFSDALVLSAIILSTCPTEAESGISRCSSQHNEEVPEEEEEEEEEQEADA
jgi:hypothetical protein